MARKGWVLLWHRLGDHPLWLEETFTRGQAWVDLILMASTQETENSGEVYCSKLYLSKRWKWSHHKVTRFLERLEKAGMIFVNKNDKPNGKRNGKLLTIAKYKFYQFGGKQNGKQNDNKNGTQNGNIEIIGKEAARTADAGEAVDRRIPVAFREMFGTFEEYDEWRRRNT